MQYFFYYNLEPIGAITISASEAAIVDVSFGKIEILSAEAKETSLIKQAAFQLEEYFTGKRKVFDLPLAPKGTEFQKKIWKSLQQISYGETKSYKEIAIMAECPKGCRAVGMANNKNPIAIIIPCHRVIGSNGKMVGYADGLNIKEQLLQLEKGNM